LPALIRKIHEAKVAGNPAVTVWGSGSPLREFLHVDDLAEACLFLMNLEDTRYESLLKDNSAPALINVGSGEEVTIRELALLIKRVVGFEGELVFDVSKPDGSPRKLADVSRLRALGWKSNIKLANGIAATYDWYLEHLCGTV
jgi:GDP-L-fucose synthase